ncbi:DUF4268 domain-containing protein [Thiofilum flexile]|uniref:DUF4268 domain-containing protein n=1 Tax=Thiofilum flexile TaxID=125627 RepID=UPI00036B3F5B|nr:DUF4268 domain-containing protein [Thiofilum flexile]
MYIIDPTTNRIQPLQVKTFSELGLTERNHLQEWLANQPDALGEELLIIQKEFDGFDDTRERLDLLAVDKDGNLVIIENKLDDSGRDVVWQALKYASYCASLSKLQIIDIYQQYLNRHQPGTEAQTRLCEFLDTPDIEEVILNSGNSQRLMLVAANFRKEVTSTALWLLGQDIAIQCLKVTPYTLGDQLLLNIEQIIPTPEEQELRIGMSAKEAEEKTSNVLRKNRHPIRMEFWEQVLEAFHNSPCNLYNNISPSNDHWLSAGSGVTGCPYNLIFGQKFIRVELSFQRASTEENKLLFDHFYAQREALEHSFGAELEWLRLDHRKASRVQLAQEFEGYDRSNWPDMIQWLVEHMIRLENTFKEPLWSVIADLKRLMSAAQPTDLHAEHEDL